MFDVVDAQVFFVNRFPSCLRGCCIFSKVAVVFSLLRSLAHSLVHRGGIFASICSVQILVHHGAPSRILSAWFCIFSRISMFSGVVLERHEAPCSTIDLIACL